MATEPTDPGARRRRYLALVLKIALGVGILAFIATRLTIADQVLLQDGTELRGQIERVEGSVRFAADHPEKSWSLDERPPRILSKPGDRWRVEPARGEQLDGGPLRLEGTVTLLTEDAERKVLDLDQVAWSEAGEGADYEERTLQIREGLRTIYGRIDPKTYLFALFAVLGMYLCGIRRWQILLRAQGLAIGFWETFRLTFIGFFFNNVVPGLTGGDVVKAVLIAKRYPGRGPDAVSTVIVDRVIGLLMLAFVAGVVLLFAMSEYAEVAFWVFLLLVAAGLTIPLFLSRRVRRRLKLDWLLERMPGSGILKRLDEAFLLYRKRPREMAWAFGLSILAHVCNIASVALIGLDLGVGPENGLREPALMTYAVVVPVTMIVAAVPVLPGGWGVGEAAFGYFFRTVGIHNLSLSIGLSVLHRATLLAFSLLGGIFLLQRRQETREALAEAPPG